MVSEDGIRTDPDKIAAVRELRPPTSGWHRGTVDSYLTLPRSFSR